MEETTEMFCIVGEAVPVEEPVFPAEPEFFIEPVEDEADDVEYPVAITMVGVVSGCKMLNIRVAPDTSAEVVAIVSEGTEVMVDAVDFGEDWYSVCLASGITGFCMKKFIFIEQ